MRLSEIRKMLDGITPCDRATIMIGEGIISLWSTTVKPHSAIETAENKVFYTQAPAIVRQLCSALEEIQKTIHTRRENAAGNTRCLEQVIEILEKLEGEE